MKKFLFFISVFYITFSISSFSQPTINGDMNETEYSNLATKQNSNNGFGSNIDVSNIYGYFDNTNNVLYLGIEGKLNTGSNDGIGIWIGVSGSGSPSGTAAGNSLGGISGAGHYMEASNSGFKADFEVDYMFAINPGTSSTNCYVNAASRVGTPAGVYLGNCGQSGSSSNYSTTGTVFSNGYTITFAFNNAGTSKKGFEIKIPYGAIGASSSMSIAAFSFVVSNTAFFSDVTVPGSVSGGNLGNNPNFSSIGGGPYNSGNTPLPVQLSSFTASLTNKNVILNWATSTEVNNYGFEIERQVILRQAQDDNWEKVGFVFGSGNSNSTKEYSFIDNTITNSGKYAYRLKQINSDGSFEYSNAIEIDFTLVDKFSLEQNYPNPFNPSTVISYQLPVNSYVTLKLYDILGKEVATLVDGFKEAGRYEIELNVGQTISLSPSLSPLSSGVYFYKLQAGDFVQTRKMILAK